MHLPPIILWQACFEYLGAATVDPAHICYLSFSTPVLFMDSVLRTFILIWPYSLWDSGLNLCSAFHIICWQLFPLVVLALCRLSLLLFFPSKMWLQMPLALHLMLHPHETNLSCQTFGSSGNTEAIDFWKWKTWLILVKPEFWPQNGQNLDSLSQAGMIDLALIYSELGSVLGAGYIQVVHLSQSCRDANNFVHICCQFMLTNKLNSLYSYRHKEQLSQMSSSANITFHLKLSDCSNLVSPITPHMWVSSGQMWLLRRFK